MKALEEHYFVKKLCGYIFHSPSRFYFEILSLYECKYHIVFCPKYCFRIFDGEISEYTKQQIYILCRQKESVELI